MTPPPAPPRLYRRLFRPALFGRPALLLAVLAAGPAAAQLSPDAGTVRLGDIDVIGRQRLRVDRQTAETA